MIPISAKEAKFKSISSTASNNENTINLNHISKEQVVEFLNDIGVAIYGRAEEGYKAEIVIYETTEVSLETIQCVNDYLEMKCGYNVYEIASEEDNQKTFIISWVEPKWLCSEVFNKKYPEVNNAISESLIEEMTYGSNNC